MMMKQNVMDIKKVSKSRSDINQNSVYFHKPYNPSLVDEQVGLKKTSSAEKTHMKALDSRLGIKR